MQAVRVTEVLNHFKEQWYVDWVCRVGKMEAYRTGRKAMKVGSRVDELIKFGECPKAKDSAEVKTAFEAFEKWRDMYTPKEFKPGVRINGIIEGIDVTGEPDLFVDGALIDIKCAGKISPNYWIQVCVYHRLAGLAGDARVGILRLDKNTGSYEYVLREFDPFLVDVWCGLARAYVYYKGESDNAGDEL